MNTSSNEPMKDISNEPQTTTEAGTAEYDVISIPISDGTERDFAIIETFQVEGKDYVAVSLIDGDEIQEGVYLYRYKNADDGDMIVEKITLPSEYKRVVRAYEKMQ